MAEKKNVKVIDSSFFNTEALKADVMGTLTFGDKITQKAESAGMTPALFKKYMEGEYVDSIANYLKICSYLGKPLGSYINNDGKQSEQDSDLPFPDGSDETE